MSISSDNSPPLRPPENGSVHAHEIRERETDGDYRTIAMVIGGIIFMFLLGVTLLVVAVMSDWSR